MTRHGDPEEPEPAAPALLVMFLAATMAVVGAVVAIGVTDDAGVVGGAVGLLAGVLAFVMRGMNRILREDELESEREAGGARARRRLTKGGWR